MTGDLTRDSQQFAVPDVLVAPGLRRAAERLQSGIAAGDYRPGPLAADDHGVRWHVGRLRTSIPDAGR